MKAQFQTLTKVAQLFALIALLSACGSSVEPRDGASQPGTVPNVGNVVTQSGEVGTQCNFFDSTQTRLSGRVTTTYLNGQLQEDKIRLRITSLDSSFDTATGMHLKFFRWQVSSTGAVNIDSNPVEFIVEKGTTNTSPVSGRLTSLSATDMASLRSSAGITGTTAIDFLSNTVLILQNVDYNWQALKVVLYDNAGTAVGQADLLLPIFAANPNKYASTHVGALPALHPMYSQRAQNLTDADWGARFASYCF